MKTIGIFPASGALATSTYTHLLARFPADHVVLISRDPSKTPPHHQAAGARLRQASYESPPPELEAAFRGVDVLFLVSYPSHVHDYRVRVQLPALDAARAAGVRHVFYSSLAFALPAGDASEAVVMRAHLDTEAHLRALAERDPGFSWTSVREGLYAESFPIYTAFFDLRGADDVIRIPYDGGGPGISWAKRDELGEATAILLADYARAPGSFAHTNQIVALTGPKEWSLADTVRALSRAAGRAVRIEEVDVEEYAAQARVRERFGGADMARSWATAWAAVRAGEAAYVGRALGEVLGREPEGFEETIGRLAREG